jgi:hypothetical protein
VGRISGCGVTRMANDAGQACSSTTSPSAMGCSRPTCCPSKPAFPQTRAYLSEWVRWGAGSDGAGTLAGEASRLIAAATREPIDGRPEQRPSIRLSPTSAPGGRQPGS